MENIKRQGIFKMSLDLGKSIVGGAHSITNNTIATGVAISDSIAVLAESSNNLIALGTNMLTDELEHSAVLSGLENEAERTQMLKDLNIDDATYQAKLARLRTRRSN
jgi:hypothetical protein